MSTPLSSSSSGSGLSSPASNGLGVVLESDMHAQTITVTVSWAVIGLVVLGSVVVVAVVYRVVVATRYSRLPFVSPLPNSADAPTPFDLRLDSHSDHAPPIDDDDDNVDILRKVKALGFLDRQVVNELGRHLVTRKVRAGHAIIAPEDSASNQDLYVVLDGTVGVFVKGVPNATPFLNPHLNPSSNAYYTSGFSSGDSDSDLGFSSTDEDRSDLDDLNAKRPLHSKVNLSGFHLLNQVKKNATVVSSLSSILQVVTEGINLPQPLQSFHHSEANTPTIEIIPMPEPNPSSASFASTNSNSTSRASNSIPIPLPHSTASSSSDLLSSTPTSAATGSFFQQPRAPISPPRTSSLVLSPSHNPPKQAKPTMATIAITDTKLLILPADAFRCLPFANSMRNTNTSSSSSSSHPKNPQASLAHVAQVLVARFMSVTVVCMQKYLGLKGELLEIEKALVVGARIGNALDSTWVERIRRRCGDLRKPVVVGPGLGVEFGGSTGGLLGVSLLDVEATAGFSDAGTTKLPLAGVQQDGLRKRFNSKKKTMDVDESESDATTSTGYPSHLPSFSSAKRNTLMSSMRQQHQEPIRPLASLRSPTLGFRSPSFKSATPAAQYVDLKLPGTVLETETDEDKQLADAIYDSIALILGITPPTVGGQVDTQASHPYKHYASVDSIDSTDDSVSITSSQASSEFWNPSNSAASFPTSRSKHGKDIVIICLERGDVLVKEGQRDAGLWFVIDGILEASVKDGSKTVGGRKKGVFLVKPGNVAGYLSTVTGHPSLVTLKSKTDSQVAFLPKSVLEKLVERHPSIILTLAKRLESQLSPLTYQIDCALDWTHVNAGEVLYRQGDPSDSIYIILAGRLRSISDESSSNNTGKFEIYGEIGPGESLGELEVLTESRRPTTVHAIRDTEIAVIPKTLFNALANRIPEMTIQISRMLALRSRGVAAAVTSGFDFGSLNPFAVEEETRTNPALSSASAVYSKTAGGVESARNNYNLKTVGIIPVNSLVPIAQFAERLKQGLELVGSSVALLNNAAVVDKMGKHVFSTIGRLKLMSWLAEQEDSYRLVLYVADGGVGSQWTQQCIRQADCILLVGLGDEDPAIGEFERLVLSLKTTARKELVLLHHERSCVPGSTAAWLKSRLWIHAHHHVQMPLSSPKALHRDIHKKTTLMDLQAHFQRFYSQATGRLLNPNARTSPNAHTGIRSDFARIARRLLNKSIGLALGGGGARGIAHVAIIRALEEAGVPIDMIGGTSIGSFVAGLYARENDHVSIYGRAKQLSMQMCSKWRQLLDLTYPLTSLFTGHELNRAIFKSFHETQIEDCWLPYFAVSVNITDSRVEIHRSGYMWRYVRASMSLAGYFPPLCDNGKMLVDGGYLNLVPVDIVIAKGADVAIAVDVSLWNDTSPVTYGDSLSGVWLFFARLIPGLTTSSYGRIPLLPDIQDRLAFAGSVERLEKVKSGEFYLRPNVSKYGAAEFEKYKEIYDIGYKYGKEIVRKWEKDGTLEKRFGVVRNNGDGVRRGNRRASI